MCSRIAGKGSLVGKTVKATANAGAGLFGAEKPFPSTPHDTIKKTTNTNNSQPNSKVNNKGQHGNTSSSNINNYTKEWGNSKAAMEKEMDNLENMQTQRENLASQGRDTTALDNKIEDSKGKIDNYRADMETANKNIKAEKALAQNKINKKKKGVEQDIVSSNTKEYTQVSSDDIDTKTNDELAQEKIIQDDEIAKKRHDGRSSASHEIDEDYKERQAQKQAAINRNSEMSNLQKVRDNKLSVAGSPEAKDRINSEYETKAQAIKEKYPTKTEMAQTQALEDAKTQFEESKSKPILESPKEKGFFSKVLDNPVARIGGQFLERGLGAFGAYSSGTEAIESYKNGDNFTAGVKGVDAAALSAFTVAPNPLTGAVAAVTSATSLVTDATNYLSNNGKTEYAGNTPILAGIEPYKSVPQHAKSSFHTQPMANTLNEIAVDNAKPSQPTQEVKPAPTAQPTVQPTQEVASAQPTQVPMAEQVQPTQEVKPAPTAQPTVQPTQEVKPAPTAQPTETQPDIKTKAGTVDIQQEQGNQTIVMKGADSQSVVNTGTQENIPTFNTSDTVAQQVSDMSANQPNVTIQSQQAQQAGSGTPQIVSTEKTAQNTGIIASNIETLSALTQSRSGGFTLDGANGEPISFTTGKGEGHPLQINNQDTGVSYGSFSSMMQNGELAGQFGNAIASSGLTNTDVYNTANNLLMDMTQQQKLSDNRMRVSSNASDVNRTLQHKEMIETMKEGEGDEENFGE